MNGRATMDSTGKIIKFEDVSGVCRRLRGEGKKIVQCHGTFDLVHPGHIIHLEEARALGDVLIVTVTGEKFVRKGPGRPYFNDHLRTKWLAALECVDYVVLIPYVAAAEAIEAVSPNVYCKGREYEIPENDVMGKISEDIATVERLGGKVCFVGSQVFSSTRLLNRYFDAFTPEVRSVCQSLAEEVSPTDFCHIVNEFSKLRVLVLGDLIFDRYTTVVVQGLTSKNRIISGRYVQEETQAGGALAAFRHVREFTPNARIIALTGTEPWVDVELRRYVQEREDGVIRLPGFTTIVKQRFVEPFREGTELSKLFALNSLDSIHPGADVEAEICRRLRNEMKDYDLIMVMDFGHGLLGEQVRDLVQSQKSVFLALNCQTNSNNHGFNIINRRYRRADCFALDQTELCLACGQKNPQFGGELSLLCGQLGARYGWLTRGSVETIGINRGEPLCSYPPFERNVVDPVGAGDAFFALASLGAARGLPIRLATFVGQLAGAMAVRIVGNRECVEKTSYLKSAMAMLNF